MVFPALSGRRAIVSVAGQLVEGMRAIWSRAGARLPLISIFLLRTLAMFVVIAAILIIKDAFGELPRQVVLLFALTEVRLLAQIFGISSISYSATSLRDTLIFASILLALTLGTASCGTKDTVEIPYSALKQHIAKGDVREVRVGAVLASAERLATIDQVGASPHEQSRGVGVDGDVGDHVLDQLEGRERPPELPTAGRVVDHARPDRTGDRHGLPQAVVEMISRHDVARRRPAQHRHLAAHALEVVDGPLHARRRGAVTARLGRSSSAG